MDQYKFNEAKFDSDGNIVIQDVTSSEITINLSDNKAVLSFLTGMSDQIGKLPANILDALSKVKIEDSEFSGLNVYLTVLINFNTLSSAVKSLSFGLAITNLNSSIRYVNSPYFKVSKPLELGEGLKHDTFKLVSPTNSEFPVRLEFGQVKEAVYDIPPNQIKLFRNNLSDDLTIQAFITTTLGEIHVSNEYKIAELIKTHDELIK